MNSKIKKVIVLKPGEKFTIPPDSTLLSTTGVLSSTGCPVPTPEDYECFGVIFDIGSGGSSAEPLDDIAIKGFKIENQTYLFTSDLSLDAGTDIFTNDLIAKINTNESLKTIFTNICGAKWESGGSGNGNRYIISFKSFPSLMTNSFLITSIQGGAWDTGATVEAYLPIKTRTQLTTDGVSTETCVCS